jgi:D-glycero-D-manno-heptose 1,7-bisphosphate phosphatase
MGIASLSGTRPRAVFLDRDGVLAELVLNNDTGAYESAYSAADMRLREGVGAALRSLTQAGFHLFVVSNQPSYAKGKTSLEALTEVGSIFERLIEKEHVRFSDILYCYHHPEGVVPEFALRCSCRKPASGALRSAASRHGLDLARSWMVGDRATDIDCGRQVRCRTILLRSRATAAREIPGGADHVTDNIARAVELILTAPEPEVGADATR